MVAASFRGAVVVMVCCKPKRNIKTRQNRTLKTENWYYTLSYSRRLNTRLNLNLQYRFTDRRSDEELNEYQENMVRATLNIAL